MLKKLMAAAFVLAVSLPAWSADMANGQEINKSCALCHGAHGQGGSGKLSPRIAGLPRDYIIKAMKDYVEGHRTYPLMVRTSQIDKFAERDFQDVAAYLASLDLSSDKRFDIRATTGDVEEGLVDRDALDGRRVVPEDLHHAVALEVFLSHVGDGGTVVETVGHRVVIIIPFRVGAALSVDIG